MSGPDRVLCGVGIAILARREVLLGRRLGDPRAGVWALPGGRLEPGESFEECARREVREETGLVLEGSLELVSVGSDIYPSAKGMVHSVTVGFVAREAAGEAEVREPGAFREWRWFPLPELPAELFLPSLKVLYNVIPATSSWDALRTRLAGEIRRRDGASSLYRIHPTGPALRGEEDGP